MGSRLVDASCELLNGSRGWQVRQTDIWKACSGHVPPTRSLTWTQQTFFLYSSVSKTSADQSTHFFRWYGGYVLGYRASYREYWNESEEKKQI